MVEVIHLKSQDINRVNKTNTNLLIFAKLENHYSPDRNGNRFPQ
jgi:hypothetical protein